MPAPADTPARPPDSLPCARYGRGAFRGVGRAVCHAVTAASPAATAWTHAALYTTLAGDGKTMMMSRFCDGPLGFMLHTQPRLANRAGRGAACVPASAVLLVLSIKVLMRVSNSEVSLGK